MMVRPLAAVNHVSEYATLEEIPQDFLSIRTTEEFNAAPAYASFTSGSELLKTGRSTEAAYADHKLSAPKAPLTPRSFRLGPKVPGKLILNRPVECRATQNNL